MEPTYFRTAAAFRRWLEKHHGDRDELMIGFYKLGSGQGGMTYREAVDEALCFGWIDGVRRSVDADRYENRFSPRTPKSHWSAVNTKRAKELIAEGRMASPGLAAFERRDAADTARGEHGFDRALERAFRADAEAWTSFQAQPPGYRRVATFWVMSAKR
ncbi:MAG: YdeI/OmpD-associated family protein [Actinomycetota bacterium]